MSAALSRVELFDSVPALPDVLAVLTSQSSDAWWCAALTDSIVRTAPEGVMWGSACAPWAETPATRYAPAHTITPAEAVEVLATRGLWPWPVGDDAAPRWWCERCGGSGSAEGRSVPCGACGATMRLDDLGHTADPPTLAALVAVASLGAPTLLRVEELARVLVGRAPRVVFRIVARETARERHERTVGREPRATPAERDLAALGLHLVALDGDRITLAVEAL